MTRRLPDLALIALAVLAAVLVVLAFRGAGSVPGTLAGEGTASLGAPVAGASAGSDEPDEPGGDVAAVTQGPVDDDAQPVAALEVARMALQSPEPITISVLGDSTSNTRQEWVHLWAQALAGDRPVSISHWNESTEEGFVEPDVLSTSGDRSPVTIWSGSQGGASAAYPVQRLDVMVPEPPDLVLLNFGHNQTAETVQAQFQELLGAVRGSSEEVPVVVVLQQPQAGDANAEVRQLIREWAEAEGLAVVDVAAAFLAQDDFEDLLEDPVHPNQEGSQLWAGTVELALLP